MMLHQDGSRHEGLEGQPALDLIVTLDDATGAVYSAFLIEEEGTASTFRALNEVFSEHGLPMSLYRSRLALFPHHQGGRDRPRLTDPGGKGALPTRRRAHRGLLAAGQGAIGARLPDIAGPAGEGTEARGDRDR